MIPPNLRRRTQKTASAEREMHGKFPACQGSLSSLRCPGSSCLHVFYLAGPGQHTVMCVFFHVFFLKLQESVIGSKPFVILDRLRSSEIVSLQL